ncbi:MAG: sulfite exporter TauE/SafE family protein [Acidobacteria bacterium]|nr:sulfite exporter TauE/SafE family protein [Acidobacteriota bacterium]
MLFLAVIAVATLVRSAFGFGEALVAVPLLALLMPVNTAAPVAALISITVAGVVLVQDWAHVHVRSAAWLVASTMVGVPLGVWLLTHVPEGSVKAALALIIIGFSSWSLWSGHRAALGDDRRAWMFGFVAGVLGGAYGMNGPPLAIYGTLRGWTPAQFRATLQGYFLPASVAVVSGYWVAGLWTRTVTQLYLTSLPVVVLAILMGRVINRRLHAARFVLYVHAGVIVIGIILLLQAIRA